MMHPRTNRRLPLCGACTTAVLIFGTAGCGALRPATAANEMPGIADTPADTARPAPASAASSPPVASRMDLAAPLAPFAPPPFALTPPPPAARLERARVADAGMDSTALARVDSLIVRAIRDGVTPGAALAVGRRGGLVRLRGYGRVDWARGAAAVSDSTVYDLASLTKVVATTTAAMLLVEERLLHLDAPLARWIPEWADRTPQRFITPRHLLTHSGGLSAGSDLYGKPGGWDGAIRAVIDAPLIYWPGSRMVYSDFDMILLGAVLERIAGETLDYFMAHRVFGPLGMRDTGFNPWDWPGALTEVRDVGQAKPRPPILARVAPTELDRSVRRRHLHGEVHDLNAHALGGVAGHAGLFSSARDLAVFAQFMLNGGAYGDRHLLRPRTIELFTMRQSPLSARALGWETPSGNSSAGAYFPVTAYGHTGFTGTSIWIDPERDLFVVLLTNRVNPTSRNQKHVPLRRAVHDAVQLAITDAVLVPRAGD